MATIKMFFAGAGGQGVLLMGQLIAYAAMHEDKQVTFLPAYGPEMRGGTANCTVVVSDKAIMSPLITEADAVVALNLPSLLKFESMVKKGGKLFINSSIIDRKAERTDIEAREIDAAVVAERIGNIKTANMVLLGDIVRATGVVSEEAADYALQKVFSGSKVKLYDINKKAFDALKEGK